MKHLTVSNGNLPVENPIWKILLFGLWFDRISIPEWGWIVFGCVASFCLIKYLIDSENEEPLDIFDFDDDEDDEEQSSEGSEDE